VIERDYLMRLIQQLTNALARIMRAKEQEKYDEAQEAIDAAYGELFGLNATLVSMMAAESLAQLLGDPEKIKAMARLFEEEADLWQVKDDVAQAAVKYQRALELYLEAMMLQSSHDAECEKVITSLVAKIDLTHLPKKYMMALNRIKR
jgi:hypothetical protein